MKLQKLKNKKDAQKVIKFLLGSETFHWKLSKTERQSIKDAVLNTLKIKNKGRYWFYENARGEIIGAGGVEQLSDTTGGYYLRWFAIRDYRKKGLGRKIIEEIEKYIRPIGGRFISIDTGEDNLANVFYQKVGYQKVGFIPEYFKDKVAKVIYYKKISNK
jgi:ribosomal protein S18 acetylase RimI-like enzyme